MLCYKDMSFCYVGDKCDNAFKVKGCRAMTEEESREIVKNRFPVSFCSACEHFKEKE